MSAVADVYAARRARLDGAVACAGDWAEYEAGNRRAAVEYRLRPAIVPLLIDSLDRHGVGVTCVRFGLAPGGLVAWFPELIERTEPS